MNHKKVILLITAALISANIFAGCGKKEVVKSVGQKLDGYLASKTAIDLSVHLGTVESGVFNDEWPIFKKAAKMTNVQLKGSMPKTITNLGQAFSLMIASGDIPDIVQTSNTDFFKYGEDGAFESLDELIEKNAPNLKKFLNDNPDVKAMATGPDGKIWFIPFIQDGKAQSGWFIRQDWLDKLGLKMPTNINELTETFKAFRDKDPNGNGKKDEIPYFHRSPKAGIEDLLILWKAYPSFYAVDGKVVFGPKEKEYKTAIENISTWYKEGLIDKEIYTRGAKARDILLSDNLGGATHDLFGSTASYNDKLGNKINGFLFAPITPPAGVDGKIREATKRAKAKTFGWGMSSSNKHKAETMKYFDFWFTQEGRRMANFGIEGDTYNMKDGKPIFTEKVLKGEKPAVEVIRQTGAQSNFGFQQDYFYEQQWTNQIANKSIKEYVDKNYFIEQYPTLKFTQVEQKEVDKVMVKINTYVTEVTQQWILGAKPINFEDFNSQLEKLEIKKIIDFNQKAYDRYKSEAKK